MTVLSMDEYKKIKNQERFFDADTVISLPVAPLAVARTKACGDSLKKPYCMTPGEVLPHLAAQTGIDTDSEFVAAIVGPGDPFATPVDTVEVVENIRSHYPNAKIALRTMGMGGASLATPFAEAGVNYVELVTDGFSKQVLESIYVWIRPGRKTIPLSKAADVLVEEQRETVAALKQAQVKVSGNITCYAGSDAELVCATSSVLKEIGVDAVSISLGVDSDGASVCETPLEQLLDGVDDGVPIVGALPKVTLAGEGNESAAPGAGLPRATPERPNVAVVSSNGIEVDMHLGQADQMLIYGPRGDGLACLLETRQAPPAGGGSSRWENLADVLGDCFALLTASAGESPRKVLGNKGIRVMVVNDIIEGCVDVLYGGGKKSKCKK